MRRKMRRKRNRERETEKERRRRRRRKKKKEDPHLQGISNEHGVNQDKRSLKVWRSKSPRQRCDVQTSRIEEQNE